MSSKYNDQSTSSRDQDYKKYNSKRQSDMSSKCNDQSSSSRDKDNQCKHQVELVTVKKDKVQNAKPIALMSPQKRDDIKPMFTY